MVGFQLSYKERPCPAWAFWRAVSLSTSVGRDWFPNHRPIRRPRDGHPSVSGGLRKGGGLSGLHPTLSKSAKDGAPEWLEWGKE